MHSESGCYIQGDSLFTGNRNYFPPYPDFLKAEIKSQKAEVEGWEGDLQTVNTDNQEDSFDLDNSQTNQVKGPDDLVDKLPMSTNMYLETDTRRQSFTDSCWEIQMINAFTGGIVDFGQKIRLKHVITDSFLALDAEQLFLILKKDPVQ